MQKIARLLVLAVLAPALLSAVAAPAAATSSRTFVSGTGTDSGTCPRATPCATFDYALTQTSAGGEINCLNAGEYSTGGNLTIAFAVTISCEAGTAGITVPHDAAGIQILAGDTDDITLRGLDINGLGIGGAGIYVLSARTVHIENCAVRGFRSIGPSSGIITATNNANTIFIYVTDSVLSGNSNGVSLFSTGGYKIASLKNVTISGSTNDGVLANNPAVFVNITESIISGNGGSAVRVAAGGSEVNVDRTTMANNVVALNAAAGGATIRAIGNNIFNNTTAFSFASGATIATDGQNRTGGNINGQNANASVTLK